MVWKSLLVLGIQLKFAEVETSKKKWNHRATDKVFHLTFASRPAQARKAFLKAKTIADNPEQTCSSGDNPARLPVRWRGWLLSVVAEQSALRENFGAAERDGTPSQKKHRKAEES